jgi:tripartite-type tricarboxylate transporter receptor subunit TctC
MMVAALLLSPGMAAAQGHPAGPMTVIVAFVAGGATDTLARFLIGQMRGILGQPIVIENVAGAAVQFDLFRGLEPVI